MNQYTHKNGIVYKKDLNDLLNMIKRIFNRKEVA